MSIGVWSSYSSNKQYTFWIHFSKHLDERNTTAHSHICTRLLKDFNTTIINNGFESRIITINIVAISYIIDDALYMTVVRTVFFQDVFQLLRSLESVKSGRSPKREFQSYIRQQYISCLFQTRQSIHSCNFQLTPPSVVDVEFIRIISNILLIQIRQFEASELLAYQLTGDFSFSLPILWDLNLE